MNLEKKNEIKKQFQTHANDSGSVELQIALMTERINELNKHFTEHAKDNASKTGLMKLVGRRRRFLKYIEEKDAARYKELITLLSLRR